MRKTVITFLGLLFVVTGLAQETALKPRLVVFTDIAPADVEPDDMESMVQGRDGGFDYFGGVEL